MKSASADIDDHLHCAECFRDRGCLYERCAVVECPENCGANMHACKAGDHLSICKELRVACLNETYGCPIRIKRNMQFKHLRVCPASVVICGVDWNRKVVNPSAKQTLKRIAKGHETRSTLKIDDDEIDVCLALSDQDKVIDSYTLPRLDRKKLTDFFNPGHPVLPVASAKIMEKRQAKNVEEEDFVDSSDEENREKELLLKKKKSRFAYCYQCRIDPSSQHLHTLGNMMTTNFQEPDENHNAKKAAPTVLPEFYRQRKLYLNITSDFMSANMQKIDQQLVQRADQSIYTFKCGQPMRRDEYSQHYSEYHNDIVQALDNHSIIRCPLSEFGCNFLHARLQPKQGRVRFNPFLDCCTFVPRYSKVNDEYEEERCHILELPPIMLLDILTRLEGSALSCFSATCKSLRAFTQQELRHCGIVQLKWIKTLNDQQQLKWVEAGLEWSFSKCHAHIGNWQIDSIGLLSNHLQNCEYNLKIAHEDKVLMFGPQTNKVLSERDNKEKMKEKSDHDQVL